MCCGGDAPQPDPSIGNAQTQLANLAVRQQDWYENTIAPRVLDQLDANLAISERQSATADEIARFQLGESRRFSDRYWNTQAPLEDDLISQARKFNEVDEQERMAATAGADVEQAAGVGRESLQRGLRGMGINMGSAASIAAMSDQATQVALAKAGAVNKTREAARQLGWTRMGEAAALGRGMPAFGTSSAQIATGATGAAGQAAGQGIQGLNSATTAYGSLGSSTAGMLGQSGNLGAQLFSQNMAAYNSQQQSQGQAIGSAAMAAALYFSDPKLKKNIKQIGTRSDGIPLYEFEYVWGGPRHIGVMSTDVRKVKPEAVSVVDGFDVVDYSML